MVNLRMISTLALVAGIAAYPVANAQDKAGNRESSSAQSGKLSSQDARQLEALAQSDIAEVAAGKLAASKARSEDVKKYAEDMVKEHSKMLDEGGKLARSKGVQPPSSPDSKHEAAMSKLQGLSGEEFDRTFMSQMVNDHRDALKVARDTASKADDPQLKAHAEKAAQHIQEHLRMAEQISTRISSRPLSQGSQNARGDSANGSSSGGITSGSGSSSGSTNSRSGTSSGSSSSTGSSSGGTGSR